HESIHAIVLFVGEAIGRGQGAKGRGHGRMARRELIEFCRLGGIRRTRSQCQQQIAKVLAGGYRKEPDAPRVLIESMEKSKASRGESRAPSHKYAAAQIPHSIMSATANSSPITATIQIMIRIRCHKTNPRVSSRSRILTAAIPIITTAAAWIAMVNAMSDRPQRQLG